MEGSPIPRSPRQGPSLSGFGNEASLFLDPGRRPLLVGPVNHEIAFPPLPLVGRGRYMPSNVNEGFFLFIYSEGARQQFELLRDKVRNKAATSIQASWRRSVCERKWPTVRRQLQLSKSDITMIRKPVVRYASQVHGLVRKYTLDTLRRNIFNQ